MNICLTQGRIRIGHDLEYIQVIEYVTLQYLLLRGTPRRASDRHDTMCRHPRLHKTSQFSSRTDKHSTIAIEGHNKMSQIVIMDYESTHSSLSTDMTVTSTFNP